MKRGKGWEKGRKGVGERREKVEKGETDGKRKNRGKTWENRGEKGEKKENRVKKKKRKKDGKKK